MVRSRITRVLGNCAAVSSSLEGFLIDQCASSAGGLPHGLDRMGGARLITACVQPGTGTSQQHSRWRAQRRHYSAVGHELPIFDTHHVFRVVATCSIVAALSNAWFSGSGLFGDISTHVTLLRGNAQMRIAGLQRMQRLLGRKDENTCIQDLIDSSAFPALIEMMRSENNIDVWRQLCSTMVDICDSPVLYRELASSNVCTVLSERLASGDEDFRSAAAMLVHKLVSLNGTL